jgi:phosphate-selective porin OprO/OprP
MGEAKTRVSSTARSWLRKAAVGAATSALLAAGSGGVAVADTKTDAKIKALEAALQAEQAQVQAQAAQMQALSAQIADLKASTSSDIADVRATASANQVALANGRPTISNADGSQKFAVRALVQFDATRYFEDNRTVNDLNSGTNFRRARLGVEGAFAKDWNYALTAEFGGSGAEAVVLNQGYVEYTGFKPGALANPLRLRIGAWAQPANLEDATNNTEGLFLERPAVAELVRGVAAGDGRSGIGFNANGDRWFASATLTGDVVGQGSASSTAVSDEQTGFLARAAYEVLKGPDHGLHVGANISGVIDPQDTGAGPATTKTLRLRERPELRVDDTRLVDTGAINADGLLAYGGELGANWKNLYIAGEYFKIDVDKTATSLDPSFDGWYVQGAWTLTGEKHEWNAATGGFKGVRAANPFDPANHHWGAWEVAARYSVLDLNYHAGVASAPLPAGGVRGGEQDISTLGLNFYPNNVVRFLLDYEHARIDKITGLNTKAQTGFDALSLRTQVAF